jgi:hypothetical protein
MRYATGAETKESSMTALAPKRTQTDARLLRGCCGVTGDCALMSSAEQRGRSLIDMPCILEWRIFRRCGMGGYVREVKRSSAREC